MRRILAVAAALLIGAGLVIVGADVYKVVDPRAGAREQALQQDLRRQWSSTPTAPSAQAAAPASRAVPAVPVRTGQPFAMLQIPAFGNKWKFAVVEGATLAQLSTGPGHVTGTQLPGQPGNFAVAAHDVTAGNPFLHLKTLRAGDTVYVTTKYATYKYVITGEKVVRYTDVKVLAAVPGQPGATASKSYLTLITCTPVTLSFTPWRVVVTGELASVTPA